MQRKLESTSIMRGSRSSVQEDSSTRALIERRCFAPVTLNDDAVEVPRCAWNSRYRKLPQQLLLNLSVLKLDGSLFDVCIPKNATVAELKVAVEEVFASFQKEISWSHVWGHFCLSYDGQKLIKDKVSLQSFGIKDGDQLRFIRHMSIQNSPLRKRPKNKKVASKQLPQLSSASIIDEDNEETEKGDNDSSENQDSSKCYSDENQGEVPMPGFKLPTVMRGWLSSSSLSGVSRDGSEVRRPRSPRFGLYCLGGGPENKYVGSKRSRNGSKME